EHVVRQHRNLRVGPRVLDVHRRERPVGIPRRPAAARVDAAGEVLVPKAERRDAAQRGGPSGLVRHAELEGTRPPLRERRQTRVAGRAGGAGADERCEESRYLTESGAQEALLWLPARSLATTQKVSLPLTVVGTF